MRNKYMWFIMSVQLTNSCVPQVTTEEPVIVNVPNYVINLGKLLNRTPKRYCEYL